YAEAEMWNPNTRISEDCQYLSVWTPSTDFQNRAKPLVPFMVWIYGGGFSTGTASLDVYDGRFLIHSQQVVLVSMIYRVGALDFLSLPESKSIKGNVGLFNQCLALSWMARNIDAFGGDPSSVTLFGESAGAGSVGHHLLSQVEPEKIVSLQFDDISDPKIISVPFQPTVDGEFLVDMQSVLIQSGCFLKIELLLGLNRNQGTYFLVYGAPGFGIDNQSLINQDQFVTGVSMGLPGFSDIAREVAAFQYTDWTDEQNKPKSREALGWLVGDRYFSCSLLDFALRYGDEIPFVFGIPLNHIFGFSKDEEALSRRIMDHWSNFARRGLFIFIAEKKYKPVQIWRSCLIQNILMRQPFICSHFFS
uniref:Carboxylic ester hydrolase n=1 Tax=Cyprinus carpio TaxID=7962 RepID=A0A8C1VDA8_CYPCA